MTPSDQQKLNGHQPNIVNGIEIPPLELYPQTHLCVEAQTLTHSPSEPWILAPIVVQFQKTSMKKAPVKIQESRRAFIAQTILPFFFAGLGLICAGHILENGEKSALFQQLPDLVTLVPTLLGLKGNLEMTLGSRLSTLAHLGEMDSFEKIWSVAISNLALVQCQAIFISTIAVIPAVLLGEGENSFENIVTTLFASVSTASITSFVLGIVMILVVIISRRFRLNPDNIVTPVAASLGDVATLQILLLVGGFMLSQVKLYGGGIPAVGLAGFYIIAVLGGYLAQMNRYTFEVLKHGWYPILIAMVITLGSGFVLKEALHLFPPIAAFTPLVNGVGGNLVAVQTSRIGTRLHQARKNKEEVAHNLWMYANPWHAFFKTHEDSITARLLIMMSLPGNLIFLQVVFLIGCGFTNSLLFTLSFVFVSFIQISTLLYICQILVRALWKRRVDPDNAAIPLLTALGDLFGTGLLFFDFWLLFKAFNMTALANAEPTGTH